MTGEKQLCLSARLQLIADLVPQGSRLADIGTDHAYLPVWLVQQGRISFAAACDVNAGPLERARATALRFGCTDALSFRLGDGLACVSPDEVDTIVIAGMGGETIAAILEAAPWTREQEHRLLLQPMTKAEVLRPWLTAHGYAIREEHLVYENHTYFPVLSVVGGAEKRELTPGQCWGGVALEHDALQGAALKQTITRLRRALDGLEHSETAENRQRAASYRAALEELCGMKEDWERANS